MRGKPFTKGHPKLGGKKAGSQNLWGKTVEEIMASGDYEHPLAVLAKLQGSGNDAIKVKAAAELAKYSCRQLKSIEHSGPDGGAIPMKLILEKIGK